MKKRKAKLNEIEPGKYIRTRKGYIYKVKQVVCKGYPIKGLEGSVICDDQNSSIIKPEEIVNCSENRLKLIEEGDIIEYNKNQYSYKNIGEVRTYHDVRKNKHYLHVEGFELKKVKILRILTKESFDRESYKTYNC